MDLEKAIALLHVEQACIRKADAGCDRQCDKCFLVRPTEDLLSMYAYVIGILERFRDDDKRRVNLGSDNVDTIDVAYLDGTQIIMED